MKRFKLLHICLFIATALLGVSCNENESDLLEPKLYFENDIVKVEVEDDNYACELSSRLSKAVDNNVNVTYSIGGQDLVDKYNQKHGTSGVLMASDNYVMQESSSTIDAGDIYASPCKLELKNIQSGKDGVTYILPVVLHSTDLPTISEGNVVYIVSKKPVVINKVYDLNPNWYEALVYAERWKNLGTIMGNEGILIMRTGDLKHPDNELQMAGNIAMQIPDVSILQLNKWYHVAFTYDAATGIATLYVNGQKITDKTVGAQTFDLSSRFTIGYAYDYGSGRKWFGFMSEVRLWSVARTANQIKENMMYVDPKSEGLVGYWKMNGDDIEERNGVWYLLDQTPNHNDATSNIAYRGESGDPIEYAKPVVVDMRVKIE